MEKKITIAIDAMGGDNSPKKTIEGLSLFLKKNFKNNDFFINLYGDRDKIELELNKFSISKKFLKIVHSSSVISDDETPLTAVKNSKIPRIERTLFLYFYIWGLEN